MNSIVLAVVLVDLVAASDEAGLDLMEQTLNPDSDVGKYVLEQIRNRRFFLKRGQGNLPDPARGVLNWADAKKKELI